MAVLRTLALVLTVAHTSAALAQPPTLVRGRVIAAETGLPLRGVRVAPAGGPVTLRPAVRTDGEGNFQLPVPARRLTFIKAGFVRREVEVPSGGVFEVVMTRGAAVTVHVFDALARPVAGVSARVSCGGIGRGAPSDDRGQVRFGGLAAGPCEVSASSEGPVLELKGEPTVEQLRAAHDELRRRGSEREARRRQTAMIVELRPGDDTAVIALDSGASGVPPMSIGGAGEPQPQGTGAIAGRVTTVDGRPVPGARVLLAGPSRGATVTDASGSYVSSGLPAGRYRIRASGPPGLVSAEFGQSADRGPGQEIALGEGQRLSGIDITLRAGGVISGRVFDEYGEPAEEAYVQVMPVQSPSSAQIPFTAASVRTDDRGSYRAPTLAPGTYRVAVSLGPPGTSEQFFYPGVLNTLEATAVTVTAGNETADIDLALDRSPGARLSGRVINAAGEPAAGGLAMLVAVPATDPVPPPPRTTQIDALGEFGFTNVSPGEYEVSVSASPHPFVVVTRRRGEPVPAPAIPATEYGRTVATVSGATTVTVRTRPGTSVRGTASVEGDGPASLSGVRLGATAGSVPPAALGRDGTFEFAGLSAPARFVLVSGPPGLWLKSFTVNGVNGADHPVDFSSVAGQTLEARAVLAPASRVEGRVLDASGSVSAVVRVLAFPVDRSLWYAQSRYIVTARPDPGGRFQLDLPPGSYRVTAVDRADAMSEETLRLLEPMAASVTIGEGQVIAQDLRIIPSTR